MCALITRVYTAAMNHLINHDGAIVGEQLFAPFINNIFQLNNRWAISVSSAANIIKKEKKKVCV